MKFLKLRKSRLAIGLLAIIFIFACSLVQPTQVSAASKDSKNLKRWMKICQNMADKIERKHFVYNPNKAGHTYAEALKNGKGSTCAYYVAWCMQKYGVLPEGKIIPVYTRGAIKSDFKNVDKSKVNIIKVNMKVSKVNLKKGDIVFYKGHCNIYAGESASGKHLWYDAGRGSTYGHCYGSRFKNIGKIKKSYLDSEKIYYILRIKDL